MKEEGGSVISQRPRDCLGCKLVSGGGLLGAGAYISFQSRRANNVTFKVIMNCFAIGAAGLGLARLLDLPPFDKLHHHVKDEAT